jgi:hypothetical protein
MRRLTGLSGSSRVLFLLRLNRDQLMDLQDLSQLSGEPAFTIIQALIAGKEKKICPLLDSRMQAVNDSSRKLKLLQRQDKFIFEERGTNDLHLGWPILRGKFSDGTPVRAPLLFFPVELILEKEEWVLKPRKDSGITFNKSLLLAYYFYNQVKPDEDLLDTDFDDFDADSTVFRTQLYQLLKERLSINFNPDTFTDQLTPFETFTRDEFEEKHRNGELKLFPEAVLGIFPQSGSQLIPDYLELLENPTFDSLEDLFSSKNYHEPDVIQKSPVEVNLAVQEEKVYTPFPMDAWQEHALKSVRLGQSLVVQGPPGTGKSQLICNLIADSIASGKYVLLVCQKRVALDVVFNRLNEMELGEFLGLVHDFRDDRKTIFQKIARQIDRLEEYQRLNRSIDAIQTERRFTQVSRAIDHAVEELEEFRMALFDVHECGLCIKELYLTSDPRAESINIKQEYQYFHFNSLGEFIRTLSMYVRYAEKFESGNYSWKERKSFVGYTLSTRRELEQTISSIPVYQKELSQKLSDLIGLSLNLEDCENLLQRKSDADEMVALLPDELVYRFFLAMSEEKDDETSLLWLQNMERLILNCFDGEGVETSLRNDQIGLCQVALQQRMEARRNIFRLVRWELFSEHKFFLKRVLISNNLPYTKKGLRELEARLDNRLNYEHHLTAIREKLWLIDFPLDYSSKNIKRWFDKQKHAVRAKLLFNSLRELRQGIIPSRLTREAFVRMIWSVFDMLEPLSMRKSEWQQYLSAFQIRTLIHQPELEKEWLKLLHRDFDQLCEFDNIKENLKPHEKEVLNRLHEKLNSWEVEAYLSLFQNSLRLAWIDHIETKYPVLRSVSTLQMNHIESELKQLVEEKRELSKAIILLRARESICEGIEYNRLNNRKTYRDLSHQVTKRKKLWPVRKLIATFHRELFNLIPCWLASPESVSALFPMQEVFDLVIFDEASQCFAEQGIPALCRGKQVIIAGDDKQLRPFELYQARWEEDSEEPELESDSLLALCGKYLQNVNLQGHYRSKRLELIDFSNHHFYSGKLRLLPDKKAMEQNRPAIHYHKIDGRWENQCNYPEAEQVAELVFQFLADSPDKEIGIVSFNMPQQGLIQDVLERRALERGISLPSSLFVKNIENVQGDERDIILFSIGYARDDKGKLNMQFGSLNVAGGENRLNVAITRARESIVIVASIWPEDLHTEGIKNEGPKLLREYLAYARDVSNGKFVPSPPITVRQNSDWYLNTHLARQDRNTQSNLHLVIGILPFADLTVMQSTAPAGVILTDDGLFQQALTAKDPHVYMPALLKQKNWTSLRIYSRNWWNDQESVDHELAKYLYHVNEKK